MANHVRRQPRQMPSVKRHGLSALLLLGIITLSLIAWLNLAGRRNTPVEKSGPEVAIPAPQAQANADGAQALPDLLAQDNIPQDVNPTEILELLTTPDNQPPKTLGPRPPTADISPPSSARPKTVLIDGSPLGGSPTIPPGSLPLVRAPIAGLTRNGEFGPVPKTGDNGRTALKSYAKPFSPVAGIDYVAVVVGGLGVNSDVTRRAINELPGEVTLAFAADVPNLQSWIHQARGRGHEVMIELPMESEDYNPVGADSKYTLTVAVEEAANKAHLEYLLSRAHGYFAVTNYGGDRLVQDEKALTPILEHIGAAGLGFVYDGTEPAAKINTIGGLKKVETVSAQTLLDAESQSRNVVQAILSALRPSPGVVAPIGMGFSYNSTIDGIKDWIASKPRNMELAPASYALEQNK